VVYLSTPPSEELSKKYGGVISLLKFLVDDNRYSVVDRVAFALSPESAEVALLEALRIAKSLMDRSIKVKIRGSEGKVYSVVCCDYGLDEGPGINGEFIDAEKADLKGRRGYCVPCPLMPSTEELEGLINELRNDLTVGRRLAILAYGYRRASAER